MDVLSIDFRNDDLVHALEGIIDQIHVLYHPVIGKLRRENASKGKHVQFFVRLFLQKSIAI